MVRNGKDVAGRRFGRLVAVAPVGSRNESVVWRCICDCGNEKDITLKSLGRSTFSCGCLLREKAAERMRIIGKKAKHGMDGTPEHRTYLRARERCNNRNRWNWKDYGGRGIKFLFSSFEQFFTELGPKPPGMTLDRINNNGDYEPGNVRWATLSEQAINRRNDLERLRGIGDIGRTNRWKEHHAKIS